MQEETMTIHELIPVLKKGWVYYVEDENWFWSPVRPCIEYHDEYEWWSGHPMAGNLQNFSIKKLLPFDGDWKESLIEIK